MSDKINFRYKPGENSYKDVHNWNRKGGAYDRSSLLNILFYEEESNNKKRGNVENKSKYSNWYLNFDNPMYDKRNMSKNSELVKNLLTPEQLDFQNTEKEPFTLYAQVYSEEEYSSDGEIDGYGDKIEKGLFLVVPKKYRDEYITDVSFECMFLMRNSINETPGLIGNEKISLVEVPPNFLHRFFPKPTKNQSKFYTKNHPFSTNELRLKLGEYKGMIDRLIAKKRNSFKKPKEKKKSRNSAVVRNMIIEKTYRKGISTTGRIECCWI